MTVAASLPLRFAHPLQNLLCAGKSARYPSLRSFRSFASHAHRPSVDFDARFADAITPDVCAHLARRGYAVVDGVFPPHELRVLRDEIASLHSARLLSENKTIFLPPRDASASPAPAGLLDERADHAKTPRSSDKEYYAGATKLTKHGVYEAELVHASVRDAAPNLAGLYESAGMRALVSVYLPRVSMRAQSVKVQFNEGRGGGFPMHYDSERGVDARKVTVMLYLDEGWEEENARKDGGVIELLPFPWRRVRVAPVGGRVVMFSATGTWGRLWVVGDSVVVFDLLS